MARRDASNLYGDEHVRQYRATGGEYGHDWYSNLRARPEAEVQLLDETFPVRARDATPEDRPAMWREMTSHWPSYDSYQQRTDREIAVVVLERS